MSRLMKNLRRQTESDTPAGSPFLGEPQPSNDTAERLIAVLISVESQLSAEQQKGPLFFALKKMAPRLVKDLRKVPEEQLQAGIRGLAAAILAAVDGDIPLPAPESYPAEYLTDPITEAMGLTAPATA